MFTFETSYVRQDIARFIMLVRLAGYTDIQYDNMSPRPTTKVLTVVAETFHPALCLYAPIYEPGLT